MAATLRYSRQREGIYEYLRNSHDHPTAEMIFNALRPDMPGLSLGTVYRNLKLLEDMGKIRRLTSNQGYDRYDSICCDHAHFVCEHCGAIADIKGIEAEKLLGDLTLDSGYSVSRMDMIITGRCPACSNKN